MRLVLKMPKYAIGDLQGHYDGLQRLLHLIQYNPLEDELWFVGDLVNRGSQSLETLKFLSTLTPVPKICLGNHDLYLLYLIYSQNPKHVSTDLLPILTAPDKEELGFWLRQQDFFHFYKKNNIILTHAGVAPMWSRDKAQTLAEELKSVLMDDDLFFHWMRLYFNSRPSIWSDNLEGLPRWQVIADYFTRMRFTHYDGELNWVSHGGLTETPEKCYPWFACPSQIQRQETIVFGHWASLLGKTGFKKIQHIDTGFHWGGVLTALNLDNFQRFSTF
jgi:bis(5'-nucleosyl)-tetraphosphatase (symmetrical)